MNKKILKILPTVFLLIGIFFITPQSVFASGDKVRLPSVSVINEIRGPELGLERRDLLESLKGQWRATSDVGVPATWLWQYSALEDSALTDYAKNEMQNQEFGVFLEIDRNFAEKAGVRYRGKGAWYFSDGLYLVSYEQHDREKLITKVFEEFKDKFGYYPKTVGAWWVGAESIRYMQEEYGITAVLQCADQFNTDKYSLWGTPWSIPYMPSLRNAAIPARTVGDAIPNIVILQWATRDPVMGYGNSVIDSTFSLQDYPMKKYKTEEYLSFFKNVYLNQPLDNFVVGLESGFGKEVYDGTYKSNLMIFKKWESDGKISLQKASEYAEDFLNAKNVLPPTKYFLTKGFDRDQQSFWYNSPNYRILIQKIDEDVFISDFRDYLNTPEEDFYKLPNTESLIRINTRAIIDSVRFSDQKIKIASSKNPLELEKSMETIKLKLDGKHIASFNDEIATFTTLSDINRNDYPNLLIEKDNISKFVFVNPRVRSSLELIPILMLIIYSIFIILNNKSKFELFISFITLLFGLAVMFPIYTSGQFFSDLMKFSPVSLPIFSYIDLSFLNPTIKIFVFFQLLPVLIIIASHIFLTKKIKNKTMVLFIYFIIFSLFFSYLDDYYPRLVDFINQGRKAKFITGLFVMSIGGLFLGLVSLYRTKKEKLLSPIVIFLCVAFVWLNQNKILAHKNYIVTPFELEMLNEVYEQKRNIVYLVSDFKAENFQSTVPILAKDKFYAQKLTSVSWQTGFVSTKDYGFIKEDELLIIPRYLGVEILDDHKLKKIFDNAQIAILEK